MDELHTMMRIRLADAAKIDRDRVSVRTGDDGATEFLLDGKPWDPEGLRQAAGQVAKDMRSQRFAEAFRAHRVRLGGLLADALGRLTERPIEGFSANARRQIEEYITQPLPEGALPHYLEHLYHADPTARVAKPITPEREAGSAPGVEPPFFAKFGRRGPPRTPTAEEIEEVQKGLKEAQDFYQRHGRSLQYKPQTAVRLARLPRVHKDPGDVTPEELRTAVERAIEPVDLREPKDIEHVKTTTFPDGSILSEFRVKKQVP